MVLDQRKHRLLGPHSQWIQNLGEDKQAKEQLKIGLLRDLLEVKLACSGDLGEGFPELDETPGFALPSPPSSPVVN